MHQSRAQEGELKYELLAEIAVGATARVELCRVLEGSRDGELVAVKRLHPHIASDPRFVDMFRDEVWMTAALKHPNVVEVVGWGQDVQGPWLAVEFVRGVSLQRLMKTVFETGERFTERMVVYLARCICDGLAAAHSLRSSSGEHLNLVHRDLTPGNILLSFRGSVKITDFGLAKAKQRLTKTLTGLLKGQPQYMSPEQVSGRPLDGRSDVFALGVVLFELFSGRRPWKAKTDLDAMRAITDEPPGDMLKLRPKIDKALVLVVNRCLEKDPAARYQSAVELRDRFDEWLIAHGYRDGNDNSLARFVRRNAMRQMRWFERAAAGEFVDQARAERLPLSRGSVPAPPPDGAAGAGSPGAAAQGAGAAAVSPDAADRTAVATPASRLQRERAAGLDARSAGSGSVGATAAQPPAAEQPATDIDWGEDGPTLIKKSTLTEEAVRTARRAPERPRAPMPTSEPTTTKQRPVVRGSSGGRPASAARQTVGADSVATAAPVSRRIVDAVAASQRNVADASSDATVQMDNADRKVQAALGVVAPEDPNVPPLPPHEGATTQKRGSRPPPTPRRTSHPPPANADATITRAKPPPDQALRDVATTQPSPVSMRTEARRRMGAMPSLDHPTLPMMVERPDAPISSERSADFHAEATRLGEEAKVNSEAARIAGRMAEASARAAALAAEAALLAAVGERHGAIQKLREAQLVDEALRRGELPASLPLAPDKDLIATGHHPRVSVKGQPASGRLGVTVVVALAVLSMVGVALAALLL